MIKITSLHSLKSLCLRGCSKGAVVYVHGSRQPSLTWLETTEEHSWEEVYASVATLPGLSLQREGIKLSTWSLRSICQRCPPPQA